MEHVIVNEFAKTVLVGFWGGLTVCYVLYYIRDTWRKRPRPIYTTAYCLTVAIQLVLTFQMNVKGSLFAMIAVALLTMLSIFDEEWDGISKAFFRKCPW